MLSSAIFGGKHSTLNSSNLKGKPATNCNKISTASLFFHVLVNEKRYLFSFKDHTLAQKSTILTLK